MKIDKFYPKELKRSVQKLKNDLIILKKKESLLHKLKRWILGS